ncbi:MAG TPA: MOSC N-terminal beta barrel domain-containing protein [Gemmatimonadales bacterium]|nr:MOSC N-terminal beta barrel domain-containing protein [Gemmatimonadales bacterium]
MQIASLARYPIKGCRGQLVPSVEIDALGVVGDRRLMLVDSAHRFLSQREVPALATVEPMLDGPMLAVRAAGAPTLSHELDPEGTPIEVRIWKDLVTAHDQGDRVAAWFTAAAGIPCRLVMFGAASHREIDPEWSVRPGAETAFADGYPLLAVVEASLDALNAVLDTPVPMGRFRPSVVVSGAEAWSEAAWTTIALGSLVADAVKPCARCLVPTTDQFTGARDPDQEPLRTLARLRTIAGLGAIFGQNLMPRAPGTLALGDAVTVLA